MDALFWCDVGALVEPDVATVDALARLQLAARRSGCRVALQQVAPELTELLELMGMRDVFRLSASAVEGSRQPEQREQPPGIEEEVDPGDPAVTDLEDLE
jgi:hypothetical protein